MGKNEDQDIVLARIDERVKALHDAQKTYVTRAEFEPVKKIVYGGVCLGLAGLATALIKLVLSA